jgi:hypothetical protein
VDIHVQDELLYNLDKLWIPLGRIIQFIREAYTSRVIGHLGSGKIVSNSERYVY